MLQNFVILRNGSEVVFLKNYLGPALTLSQVMGLSACISMLVASTKQHQGDGSGGVDGDAASGGGASSGGIGGGGDGKVDDGSNSTGGGGGDDALSMEQFAPTMYTQQRGRACTITVNHSKIVFIDMDAYLLIAQGADDDSEQFLAAQAHAVNSVLHYYLGAFTATALQSLAGRESLESVLDIVHTLLVRFQKDLTFVVDGIKSVFVEEYVRVHLDRALASLDESDLVDGGGVLVLGQSVVHGRLPQLDTQQVLLHLIARPLRNCHMRVVPVFTGAGVWRNLVLVRLGGTGLVLALQVHVAAAMSDYGVYIRAFETTLSDVVLGLPVEELPVLLRHYTSHDTIAFVYRDTATGVTIAPVPRADGFAQKGGGGGAVNSGGGALTSTSSPSAMPQRQHHAASPSSRTPSYSRMQHVIDKFVWFYARVADSMQARSHQCECSLVLRGHRFFAKVTPQYSLYVLFNARVDHNTMVANCREILSNIAM